MICGLRALFANSLQRKLVVAFLLAGVLPPLIAAYLTTKLMSAAFEHNVHDWLRDTAAFFVSAIQEAEHEAGVIAQFMSENPGLLDNRTTSGNFDARVHGLVAGLGYDLILLYDDQRRIDYASEPVVPAEPLPLTNQATLLRFQHDYQTMIMAVAVRNITVAGRPRHLLLGVWIDDSFISGIKEMTSLDLRLYSRAGDGFPMTYSSQSGGDRTTLSPGVTKELLLGAPYLFNPAADEGRYSGIYMSLKDADNRVVGVLFCGLLMRQTLTGMLSRTNLFLTIFLTGSLLSIATGMLIARRLTRPLRLLMEGVTAVTVGHYGSEVEVEGRDEVAELAVCFNAMSRRLAQLQELEAQYRRRERLSAVGEAATAIAHEVRNPLGIIKTSAELVRKHGHLEPREAGLLDHVVDEVRRIDRLIREFLEFASPRPPNLRRLAAASVVQRVAEGYAPELQRRRVALEVYDELPGAEIAGDEDHLYQACLNLILNACDAMPDGGDLAIIVARQGDNVAISFTDTGPGIPEDLRERIFNPFFTTRARGTGLGLPKVFTVIESHGGRVELTTAEGGGASFTLVLPLLAPCQPVVLPPSHPPIS